MSAYGCFALYYDALTENVGYAQRARYFDRIIKSNTKDASLLLDLACGTGSLSLELAALGYEVIGVDGSGEMLSVAMQKALEARQNILYLCQSMEELDLYGTVDACVCALDSLNHLPDEAALARVFSRVALFLSPGGLFVFDLNTAYKHREILSDNIFIYDLPGVYCVWRNAACCGEENRIAITLDFFAPDDDMSYTRQTESFSERIFSPELVDRLLRENGLQLLEVYGDDTLRPPGKKAQRLVYVTKRNAN